MSSRIEAAEQRVAVASRRVREALIASEAARGDREVARDNMNRALDDLAAELGIADHNSIGPDEP